MKKAQGISVNVIIIAAIALLVLVVLSVIFIGRMGGWGKQTNSCISNGGKCIRTGLTCGAEGSTAEDYPMLYTIWNCPDEGGVAQHCCIKAGP